jgi:hypothetical protein
LSRDRRSLKAAFGHVCRCGSGRASYTSGNGCGLHGRRRVPPWGCPTHVSRGSRHDTGACREPGDGLRRPRNLSVPSDRPLPRHGDTASAGNRVLDAACGTVIVTHVAVQRWCNQGLQYAQDTLEARRGIRRVLVPEGQFAFTVWSAFLYVVVMVDALTRHLSSAVAARCCHCTASRGRRRVLCN